MEKVLTFTIRTEAGDSTMTIAEIERRLKELTKSKKELQKEYEKEGKLTKEQQTKMKEYSTEIEVLRQKKSNLTKETRSYAKEAAAGQGTMAKLRAETARLRAENENLNLSTAAGRKQFEANNKQLIANTKQIRDYDRAVSGSKTLVGEYTKTFQALGRQFLMLAGVSGGLAAIKNVVQQMAAFEQTMSGVKAITGATQEELARLEANALRLGATTPRTASEVAKLQTEFAKLGFTTKEILAATEATLSLSIATGKDLAESANIAGATLRAFGLEAEQMPRVVDVMAKSFATSALNIEDMSNAMTYVAPVARAAGFSIEETSAMLAKLADAGIRGSMAGTGLRRIFLEVAKAGGPPKEAFDALARSGISLADANDDVGQRAMTALLVLGEQKVEVERLTNVYNEASGAGKEMATVMADNLTGDVTKLKSAWEGLVLSFKEGGNVIRDVVQGLTSLIGKVQDTKEGVKIFTEATGKNWVTFGSFFRDLFNRDLQNTLEDFIVNTNNKFKEVSETLDPAAIAAFTDELIKLTEETDQSKVINRDMVTIAAMYITKLDELAAASAREAEAEKQRRAAATAAAAAAAEADERALKIKQEKEAREKAEAQRLKETAAAIELYERNLVKLNNAYAQHMDYLDMVNFVASFEEGPSRELDNMVKSIDETIKIAKAKAEILNKETTDATLSGIKTEIEAWQEKEKRKQDITRAAEQGIANAVNGFHDMRLARMRAAMQAELNAVGNNEAAKEAIMRKYAREEQKMSVKKALIDTALMAISAGLTKPFIPAGIAAMIAAGVQGGFQIATIKAQKFATGGSVRPGSELPGFSKHGDNTLALVKPGEVILNQRQQRSLGGASTFRKIGVPGFAEGGVVGAPVNVSPMEDMVKMANMIIQGVNQKDVSLNIHRLREAEAELDVVIRRKGL